MPLREATGELKLVDEDAVRRGEGLLRLTEPRASQPSACAPPIPAATVVLVRDEGDHLETLMLRRNVEVSFGGMWVFPGGRVEPDDGEGEPGARRAAAREAAEEAGLGRRQRVARALRALDTAAGRAEAVRDVVLPGARPRRHRLDRRRRDPRPRVGHARRGVRAARWRARSNSRHRRGSRCTGWRDLRTSRPRWSGRAPTPSSTSRPTSPRVKTVSSSRCGTAMSRTRAAISPPQADATGWR